MLLGYNKKSESIFFFWRKVASSKDFHSFILAAF